MQSTIGSINFGPITTDNTSVYAISTRRATSDYRLYVKKSGIMVLQRCHQLWPDGEVVWEEVPTVFEESLVGQIGTS